MSNDKAAAESATRNMRNVETLRELTADELDIVAGGVADSTTTVFNQGNEFVVRQNNAHFSFIAGGGTGTVSSNEIVNNGNANIIKFNPAGTHVTDISGF